MRDLVIVGSGPAGLTAAIYAKRAGLDAVVLESAPSSGGQIINTEEIDNYPALPGVNGFELGAKMRAHADTLGAEIVTDEVETIEVLPDGSKLVRGKKAEYPAKTVIVATGAKHRLMGVPGEKELTGLGVSYCAVCDGAFYRGLTTAVVGGGDVAVGDALYLSRICEKVYLIHRRDSLRAAYSLQQKLLAQPNVEILWNTVVKEVRGKDEVEELVIGSSPAAPVPEEDRVLAVDGVFAAVGMLPQADFINIAEKDAAGYLIAGEDCRTSVPGIFAAGDVRAKALRQIVTAVADGANAVSSVEEYLANATDS